MPRYSGQHSRSAHDIHYSWTGWPSTSGSPSTPPTGLIKSLAAALTADSLELESHTWKPGEIHMTVAAGPESAPVGIAQRIKGRLDHALRQTGAEIGFSRKVSLRAIGHNRTPVVEDYVRDQLEHVDLADPGYREALGRVAIHDPSVDLSEPALSRHGRYWYNLHLVLVVAGRYRIGGQGLLQRLRGGIMDISIAQRSAVKRVSIMPDHMHVALRGQPTKSPAEIARGIQEATAEVAGCRLWEAEYYVGTFGEYDAGAVDGVRVGVRR